MRVAIVTFPGSNCDHDCYRAATEVLHADAKLIWHRECDLGNPDLVILPGGFSYGDYLRPGAIARLSPVIDEVLRYATTWRPLLGTRNRCDTQCDAAP